MPAETFPHELQNKIIATTFLCFFSGFIVAIFGFPCWQHAVEGAQVLAGLVQYPGTSSPFGLYEQKVWTLLHQILAALLSAGISEIKLSLVLSGLMGAFSYAALGLGILSFTRSQMIAWLAPFFIQFTEACSYSTTYPVSFMGTSTTYGVLGLALLMLCFALYGLGMQKSAGFLLGLLLSIHVSLGLWGILIFTCLFISEKKINRNFIRSFLFPGLVVTGLSFSAHIFHHHEFLIHKDISKDLLLTFIREWDSHRQPVYWNDPGAWIVLFSLILTFACLKFHRQQIPETAISYLKIILIADILSVLAIFLSQVPLNIIPLRILLPMLLLMPTRLTCIATISFPITLIGLFFRHRSGFFLSLAGVVFLTAIYKSKPDPYIAMMISSFFLCVYHQIKPINEDLKKSIESIPIYFLRTLAIALLAYNAYQIGRMVVTHSKMRLAELKNYGNDSLFYAASKGSGLLLTSADLNAIQLVTRRPILLDGGALDMVVYAPETASQVEKILREIYDTDWFHPPAETWHYAVLPSNGGRKLWESLQTADWNRLREKYGTTSLITYTDWKIQLPLISRNSNYALYDIPAAT